MARYVFNPVTGETNFVLDDIDLRTYGTFDPRRTVQPWNKGAKIISSLDEQRPLPRKKRRNSNSVVQVPKSNINGEYYTVRKGDTFYDILKNNGIKTSDMQRIAKANGIKDVDRIFVGQKIKLPGFKAKEGTKDRELNDNVAVQEATQKGKDAVIDPTKPANAGGIANTRSTANDIVVRHNDILEDQGKGRPLINSDTSKHYANLLGEIIANNIAKPTGQAYVESLNPTQRQWRSISSNRYAKTGYTEPVAKERLINGSNTPNISNTNTSFGYEDYDPNAFFYTKDGRIQTDSKGRLVYNIRNPIPADGVMLPEVTIKGKRNNPVEDLDKVFVGMMAAPLAAYGAAEALPAAGISTWEFMRDAEGVRRLYNRLNDWRENGNRLGTLRGYADRLRGLWNNGSGENASSWRDTWNDIQSIIKPYRTTQQRMQQGFATNRPLNPNTLEDGRGLWGYYKEGLQGIRTFGRSGNRSSQSAATNTTTVNTASTTATNGTTTTTNGTTAARPSWFKRLGQRLSNMRPKKGTTTAQEPVKPNNNGQSLGSTKGQTKGQTKSEANTKSKWEEENAKKQRSKKAKYNNSKKK